jgi:hypothetical protein
VGDQRRSRPRTLIRIVLALGLLVGAKAKEVLGALFAVPVTVILAAVLQELQVAQGPQTAETAAPVPVTLEET